MVTVILPLKYYHDEFLRRAVRSIVLQTFPSWSLLVVVEAKDLGL